MKHYRPIEENELVTRYLHNYGLSPGTVDINMVLKHWELERELTRKLKSSAPKERRSVFRDAYNTLYTELPWLLRPEHTADTDPRSAIKEKWFPILGDIKDKMVYEVGSGAGQLIRLLAESGAACVGTEIAESRPDKRDEQNLEWHHTDGVNLLEYEPNDHFDIVLSDQVIEHLHPDDMDRHFLNVHGILKERGRYIFCTPHYYIGPGDISRIFGYEVAAGMHLKEYKHAELYGKLRKAGFSRVEIPSTKHIGPLAYIRTFLLLELVLGSMFSLSIKKRLYHRLIKWFGVSHEIMMVAHK